MSTLDIIHNDMAGISALEAAEHGGISIQGYTVFHIHAPFSGKVIIEKAGTTSRNNKHLMWLSLPPFDIGYTSARKAPL